MIFERYGETKNIPDHRIIEINGGQEINYNGNTQIDSLALKHYGSEFRYREIADKNAKSLLEYDFDMTKINRIII